MGKDFIHKLIEYEDFIVYFGLLAEIKELRASKKFREGDILRKTLVAAGMKIGYLDNGGVKYSCLVRNKDGTGEREYGQNI